MKISLPTLAEDKANHWVYGSLIGAFTAAGVVLVWWIVAVLLDLELRAWPVAIAAGAAGIAVAAAFGWLKERNDARLNAAAIAAGQAPPHGVEFADFRATTWGGCIVGVPVLIGALVLYLAGV